ncbi:hypothetical protein EKK58_03445 [Candidatus Dependentiae bacterium]|nr:MAG: hypothetical protein EKK58_03445 [Candidatus Dependentiae bacterium]
MIKNIFVPERIGKSLLFGKKIVGIDIQKLHIFAAVVYAKGTLQKVEQFLQIPIEQTDDQSAVNPKVAALIQLKKMFGNFTFHTSISSSFIIYKELVFPFADREKIELVIKYEIEPLLPFSINDSLIDFIITKHEPNTNQVTVLAACIQKHHIAEHLALFTAAGIEQELVMVDLFGLYGLYKNNYALLSNQTVVLLDLGMYTTKIAYIQDGSLTMIRFVNQGIAQILKNTAERIQSSQQEIYDILVRFGVNGLDHEATTAAFKESFTFIIEKIQFTLNSYMSKPLSKSPHTILLYGAGGMIKNITEYLETILQLPVKLFILESSKEIDMQSTTVPLDGLYALGAAIQSDCNINFNLLKDNFSRKDFGLFIKQIITGGCLIIVLFTMLMGLHITQVSKLKKELDSSTQEVIQVLKQQFSKIPKEETNLDEIMDIANQAIVNEKELWYAFSYANQSKFLHYLLELTQKIDKDALGFEPEKITITEGLLILKAQVRDYDALKLLEKELKSSTLFSNIIPQDSPNFTMQIRLSSVNQEA